MNLSNTVNRKNIKSIACTTVLSAGLCSQAFSATVSINSTGGSHTDVGDFLAVAAYTGNTSGQGQVEQIWQSSDDVVTGSFSIGSIIGFLSSNNLSASPGLTFGFALNEKNNSPTLTISAIDLQFEKEDGSLVNFSLGANDILVEDYHSGNSHAELQLEIDFGFDIFGEWNSTTTKTMQYSFTMGNNTNGPERFFLSNNFTVAPPIAYSTQLSTVVPLPASAWLFLSAIGGLVGLSKQGRRPR